MDASVDKAKAVRYMRRGMNSPLSAHFQSRRGEMQRGLRFYYVAWHSSEQAFPYLYR